MPPSPSTFSSTSLSLDAELLRRLEPIRGLSHPRLAELASLCRIDTFPAGSDPLRELGGSGQLIYLLSGELKIVLHDGSMRVMVGACDVALWPIGYKTVLPVSCKAITEVGMLRVDFELLDIMMTWDELSAALEQQEADKRPEATPWSEMTRAFSVQALTSSALAQLPPAHIHELLRRFERLKMRPGQQIIREGDAGDFFYLIESGRCEVKKRIGGVEVPVAELRAGESFGEEALVSDSRRNASVTMKTEGVLLRLAKPDFVELLKTPFLHACDQPTAAARVGSGQAVWLDVRYPAEYAENGLPGAINLPLNEVRSAFGLLDRKREYIVYCQSGRRSSAAAFLLAQHGFKASWLQGGLGQREAS